MKDDLGDRMKDYEAATRYTLPRRTYTIVRVDGRAFHSLLRKAEKPFSQHFIDCMTETALALCEGVTGTVFAYVQSDEISLLLTDFGSVHTEPWFGGVIQKITSISASIATTRFNELYYPRSDLFAHANFDSRVFTIPSSVDVANYFLWRQRDWVRNSVSMLALSYFSHKQLHRLSSDQRQEKLWQEHKVNWSEIDDHLKRGTVCYPVTGPEAITYTPKGGGKPVVTEAIRRHWVASAAPHFEAVSGNWLSDSIPALPHF